MSKKSGKIAALIESCRGQDLEAHYLGYFECFNQQLFYESHDVLEELWLKERGGPHHGFYKALIQFAGAFVHLQKNRLRPSAALFKLARSHLATYPNTYRQLDVEAVRHMIEEWLQHLEQGNYVTNPLNSDTAPKLFLQRER